jgi:ribosome-associated protein
VQLESINLANKITGLIFNKKGYDVKILDLRELVSFADYFVICSADSDTQVKAIADEIDKSLADEGIRFWHKEGYRALSWVLIDYVDVVVHIFRKESRTFYNLERLWGDAPLTEVSDPALVKQKNVEVKKTVIKSVKSARK